jgi:hypothetical protein
LCVTECREKERYLYDKRRRKLLFYSVGMTKKKNENLKHLLKRQKILFINFIKLNVLIIKSSSF